MQRESIFQMFCYSKFYKDVVLQEEVFLNDLLQATKMKTDDLYTLCVKLLTQNKCSPCNKSLEELENEDKKKKKKINKVYKNLKVDVQEVEKTKEVLLNEKRDKETYNGYDSSSEDETLLDLKKKKTQSEKRKRGRKKNEEEDHETELLLNTIDILKLEHDCLKIQ